MAKSKALALSASIVTLDMFAVSVWNAADVSADLKAAFVEALAAGNDEKDVKRTFRDAWVANILAKGKPYSEAAMIEGARVNDLANNKSAKADDLKRNVDQERAYGAAKAALTALTKALDMTTGREGTGGRKPRQTEGEADGTERASDVVEAVPALDGPSAFDGYMERMAAMLEATARRNAIHLTEGRLHDVAAILDAMKAFASASRD